MRNGIALALLSLVIHCTGGAAGEEGPVRGERGMARTAEADITHTIITNNTKNVTRFATEILSGRVIFVAGDTAIDGRTFRHGIKGSQITAGDGGRDRVEFDLKPGATRVVVLHYRFTLEEVARAGGHVAAPATRWVGQMVGFSVLHDLPDPIDDANSHPPMSIP